MTQAEGTQAIRRATELLRIVARLQRRGATLGAVTREMGISRSTTYRMLTRLAEERLLTYDPERSRYWIGPLAWELGLAAAGPNALMSVWRERLRRLSHVTGLTAYLMARSDAEAFCLGQVDGASVVRAVALVEGERLPLGVGAGSLAILASLPEAEAEAVLEANASKLASYGGGELTTEVLRQRMERARRKGFAYSKNSVAPGVVGVGLVASDPGELTVLAVSVSIVTNDIAPARQAELARTIRDIAGLPEAAPAL
jgi:DNA-binding IclR family transcriptional regulator